ncbi:hypothetical protein OIE68_11180 [Nocardia vinacea]|uniref:hypothetical protein n=1 Tax=Nocardia vinacea TaxID=96468 RepID=UPI002E14E60C|nr:hypothetical protein OIE68_11180 [Nocardia vinacea]
MLIATLIIGTIGLVRRWLGRRTPETKSGAPQWRNAVRRIIGSVRLRRPGPALAAVMTLAGMIWVGLALAPC